MAVFEVLNRQTPEVNCAFNGLLTDFLAEEVSLDETLRAAFEKIAENGPDVRIVKDLKGGVLLDAISNRIIHYRDIGKLDGSPVVYPFILYATDGERDRAMLVVPYEAYGYLYARGYYYCLSEVGGDFYDVRNEILEVSFERSEDIVTAWNRLNHENAGAIQRKLDRSCFRNYDELKKKAYLAGEELSELAKAQLRDLEDRAVLIRYFIVRWFLLKKMLYVQYMVNKNIRSSIHDGDIHRQRNQARLYAEEVPFLSYRDMWMVGSEQEEAPSEEVNSSEAEASE